MRRKRNTSNAGRLFRRLREGNIADDWDFPDKIRDREIVAVMPNKTKSDYEINHWVRIKGWSDSPVGIQYANIVTGDITSTPLRLVLKREVGEDRYESQSYRLRGDSGVWLPI